MTNEQVIRSFFETVRSGKDPDQAPHYMANEVLAHQINGENRVTVHRTPQNYADHVREMIDAFGTFQLTVEEVISQDPKVYVRWQQRGTHIGEYEGYAPTGKEIIELASAVYRLEECKIVEYWIQIDRLGILEQLKRNQM
ncbi:polyketide cyclase [Paenibacillus selenitireducens]|uniref:Polyketide cyclase n=1 Tax=Paenibacillus selenitireducens TaxID=1324314 RepID=A0A1T2X424_9BACL|nr:ester cyclase [Paenibacillus selenitireducens]OPA74600.1 polyketide cyclase [Paenibacillus selenitireducens]